MLRKVLSWCAVVGLIWLIAFGTASAVFEWRVDTIEGPRGAQGERGPTGRSGPRGPTGLTGLRGPAGLQGDSGQTIVQPDFDSQQNQDCIEALADFANEYSVWYQDGFHVQLNCP